MVTKCSVTKINKDEKTQGKQDFPGKNKDKFIRLSGFKENTDRSSQLKNKSFSVLWCDSELLYYYSIIVFDVFFSLVKTLNINDYL